MSIKLTKAQAEEIRHKLFVVSEEPELLEDYAVTQSQVESLCDSVPERGTWNVPEWAEHLVAEECDNIAALLQGQSQGLVTESEYRSLRRQMRGFDEIANSL